MPPTRVTRAAGGPSALFLVLVMGSCGIADGGNDDRPTPTRTPSVTPSTSEPPSPTPTPSETETPELPDPTLTPSETETPELPIPTVTPSATRTPELPSPTRTPEQTESPDGPSAGPTTEPAPSGEPTSETPTSTATTTETPADMPPDEPAAESAEDEETGEAEEAPAWTWWLVALLVIGSVVAVPLVVRSRRRNAWRQDLADARSELEWFARELLPGLRQAGSREQVAGGWTVGQTRVAAAEDRLTVLESSAPEEVDRQQARSLRDAARRARVDMERLTGPEPRDGWRGDVDAIVAGLEAALRPSPTA